MNIDVFKKLLEEFARSKKEFYLSFQDRMNGSKIHLPVPVLVSDNSYCLKALVHYVWASIYLSQPYQIMQVCNSRVQYFDLDQSAILLQNWKGPIYDKEFVLLEKRLLSISEEVFECYHLKVYNHVVEEYAQTFFKITPSEFMSYYQQIGADFIAWLK
jgi:hypothetical protein